MRKLSSTLILAILLVSSLGLLFRIESAKATLEVTDPNYTLEVFASGLNGPFGMAFDSSGNLYVANEGAGGGGGTSISKITAEGLVSIYATGFEGPAGLAFDNEGNLWVSDDRSQVWKILPDGDVVLGLDFMFVNPNAIAFDQNWNLFVVDAYSGYVYKIAPGGAINVFSGPFLCPQAVAFDKLGYVFISDCRGTIFKIDSLGSAAVFSSGVMKNSQGGLAFDGEGNLYASEYWPGGLQSVFVFTPDGTGKPFITGFDPANFNFPRGLIFDSLGRLYITEYGTGTIWMVTHARAIPATVDVKPDSYNLARRADFVTAYIELSEGYDVKDIDVSTLRLNGVFRAFEKPTSIGDYDRDKIPDLMVKFNVTAPQASVGSTQKTFDRFLNITVFVSGHLKDGTLFSGNDTIKLVIPSPKLASLFEEAGILST